MSNDIFYSVSGYRTFNTHHFSIRDTEHESVMMQNKTGDKRYIDGLI